MTFRVSNFNDIGSRETPLSVLRARVLVKSRAIPRAPRLIYALSELQSAIDQRSRRLWTWQQRAQHPEMVAARPFRSPLAEQ